MQTTYPIRAAVLAAVFLALPALAQAQDAKVIPGMTVLAFDHDDADITTGYQLCVGATCAPLSPAPVKDASANVFRFTAPASLPRGPQVLTVRAVGEAGVSAPSEAVTFRVLVVPGKPGPLRAEAPISGE